MNASHSRAFVPDLLGKVGAPIFSGTLVGCILQERFHVTHGVLLAVGLALLAFGHWQDHHRA